MTLFGDFSLILDNWRIQGGLGGGVQIVKIYKFVLASDLINFGQIYLIHNGNNMGVFSQDFRNLHPKQKTKKH